ncbi:PD-(D/E)XK nuclease family protein [[Limnothrix rosea] IAM M-220]|uniref:PD-(D/E)XK nuclease family protein n=1 Tax=[Limnothrix rosea] IAM M-220 TaxID=454133 RepID=UPI00095EDA1F|nr:PD-(D/E)XK nuclease family protein [[Limnothrix rosea] IAM M-220]OKH19540.1 hypothetical protein NIES208_01675 [[Limnothrix rosea] IAM M-220]
MFYVSQAHLQRFQDCPPSFQKAYLDQLATPLNPVQQQKQEWGIRFHLAMQQLHAGFALEHVTHDPKLRISLQSLLAKIPHFHTQSDDCHSAAEYRQTWAKQDFLLTIICDWIVFGSQTLEIHDWKTYRQPKRPEKLQNHWQTKLYLYLMATTTAYQPEQLSMTYWFIEAGGKPEFLTFNYSQAWHKKISQELDQLLEDLTASLENYFEQNQPFQHSDGANCFYCLSQQKNGRSPKSSLLNIDLDQLLESTEAIEI